MTNRIADRYVRRADQIAALRRNEEAETFLRRIQLQAGGRIVGLIDARDKLDRRLAQLRPTATEWERAKLDHFTMGFEEV